MIRRALNSALQRTSTVLIGFGLVLVLIGIGVQATRALRVQRLEQRAAAPNFESSVRVEDPFVAAEEEIDSNSEREPYPGMVADLELGNDPAFDSGLDPTFSSDVELPESIAPFFIPWPVTPYVRYLPLSVLRKPRYRYATPTTTDAGGTSPPEGTPDAFTAPANASGQPERIIIPSLKLDRRVVEIGWDIALVDNETLTSVWQTARHAAGFHQGSAGVGVPGNTVISGHNNIDGAVFGELHLLEPGDRVMLEADGKIRTYEVEMNFIVQEEGVPLAQREENARWIGKTPDERLTLVTCYPPWGNSHRTIVVARPVTDQSGAAGMDGAR